jgi:hypothetical protein
MGSYKMNDGVKREGFAFLGQCVKLVKQRELHGISSLAEL